MNCRYCKNPILETYYFCPNCGRKLKEPPFKFSISRSVYIILLSIFLPPFGIIPSLRYLLARDIKAKIIGLGGIILNIVVLVLVTMYLVSTINSSLNAVYQLNSPQGSVQNQIQTLQNSGF